MILILLYWFNFFIIIYWSYIFIGYLHKNLNLLIYRVKFSHILSHYKIEVQNRTLNTLWNYTILTFKMVTSKKKKKNSRWEMYETYARLPFPFDQKKKNYARLPWLIDSFHQYLLSNWPFQYPCLTNLPLEYFSWVVLLTQPCHQ